MISVITVTYNNLEGLKKTYDSVAGQSAANFEWVVVDGGSTDGSAEFIQNCRRVNQSISEQDHGIYDAMQKGLRMSRGEWIIFMNAGDRFSGQDSLRIIGDNLDHCDVCFFSCELNGLGKRFLRKPRPLESAAYSVPAIQQATVYKRAVLNEIDWPLSYRVCGDFAIAAQLLKMNAAAKSIDQVVAEFEFGGISTVRPIVLAREAYQIQTRILNLPVWRKAIHLVRRLLTGLVVLVLYRWHAVSSVK